MVSGTDMTLSRIPDTGRVANLRLFMPRTLCRPRLYENSAEKLQESCSTRNYITVRAGSSQATHEIDPDEADIRPVCWVKPVSEDSHYSSFRIYIKQALLCEPDAST